MACQAVNRFKDILHPWPCHQGLPAFSDRKVAGTDHEGLHPRLFFVLKSWTGSVCASCGNTETI